MMLRAQRFTPARWLVAVALLGALLGAMLGVGAQVSAQAPPAAPEAETDQTLSRRAVIRFLTEGDYPPFNYLDEDNVLTGFNVDIARAVCLELAAACDIQVRPWSELIPALRRGEADAIVASHAISQNMLKAVDVTDRYYHTPARFAGPRRQAGSRSRRKGSRAKGSRLPRAPRMKPICAPFSPTVRSAPSRRPSLRATP